MTTPTKLLAHQRAAILQHGGLQGRLNGKTGLSLLRYAEARVVVAAVLMSRATLARVAFRVAASTAA